MPLENQAPDSQQTLDQRRRLETLGQLTGRVVHDFNNLLMLIDGYAQMLLEEEQLSSSARESALEILAASERGAGLTRQLLDFARAKPTHSATIDLHALLQAMQPMLQRLVGESVLLEYELSGERFELPAPRGQAEQVLLNLIVNARDAMPLGGKVKVRTKVSREALLLEVEDNGPGIPSELQEKIFEPYFTTKPEGQGTGIGLAMVAETIAEWGGRVRLASSPGEGTCFVLELPAGTRPDASAEAVMLIVEDDDAIRSLLRRILEQNQYRVVEASSQEQALQLATQLPVLDVLITDLELGDGTGQALAQSVAEAHPDVRTLYISGYVTEGAPMGGRALQKPFSPKTLVLAVQDLLKSE
jgi:two-component system cell cycle sensor histidine kinase/response regulator CckA